MSQGLSMASVNKIKELANQREYSLCVDIIDSQDLTKSLNPQFLRLCGEIYLKEGRNEDARSPLVMAHRLAPGGKRVLLDLTDLYLRLGIRKLAETYKEIYEFEVGEDEAGKREMEYLWKKAEGADSRELLEYMEQYAQNLDYDLSFELFLLYVKAGEKEKASVLCEIFSATFKNTRYAGRMQSILDGETEPDKFLDVYASEEREDDDPDFMELRIEEQRQLKADDERVHPAEARITEMVDDYSVSNRKVRRFLKVQAKEEAKAAAEAALKSSEEDASKDKSEDKAFDKTEDKAEETAEEKTVEVKTAEEKSAETVEDKTEETAEIETGEKAAETAEAKNEEKTEETVEDDTKDDTEEVKVKYKREYKQAVKRKRKRNGKKKTGDPEENKSDDIDGAGQADPDEKTEEHAEYPEQDDANNISEKDVEEGTAETDEESGTDYTEELKKDETEESKPEDESGSAQSETDSGNSESSDNSENLEDTAEKAGSEDETDNEDSENEKSEAGGIGSFFRKLKSKFRRTGDEDTEDTEAETESEEDKKAETETEETNQSGEPEQSEQSGEPEQSEQSEEPEQSEQSEQSEKPEQSEQSEQSGEPGQSEEPEDSQLSEDTQETREFKVSESSSAVFESVEVDFSENEAETNESEYEVDDFLGENTEFEESVEEITEEPVENDREEEIYEVWEDEPEPEESPEPEPENVDLSEMRAEDFPISYKKKKLEYPEFKTDLFKHHDTREVKETVNDFDEVVEKSRLSEKLKEEERLAREAEELLRSLGVGADDSGNPGFLEAEEYDALNESDKLKEEPQEESSPLEEYGISRKELKTRLKISSEKKDLLKKIRNQR